MRGVDGRLEPGAAATSSGVGSNARQTRQKESRCPSFAIIRFETKSTTQKAGLERDDRHDPYYVFLSQNKAIRSPGKNSING